ncbi:MAG: serine hydrolase [Anaerolineae bacterium]|nr:serine hydrolase [Anaerolineae bacterium]
MTVTGLGTARKGGVRLPILALFSGGFVLAALVLFALELSRFSMGRDYLQTDITVADIPVTGMTLKDAAAAWESAYEQPIELDYQGSPILLRPAEIGFRTNSEVMLADIRSKQAGTSSYWGDFWNYLWRRPTSPVTVSLVADYQEAKLRAYLQDLAARYEMPASSAAFDVNTMTFGAGATGTRLDIEAAMQAVDTALRRPTNRKVKLPMKNEGARGASLQDLKAAILQYLEAKGVSPNGPATLGSVVVLDLQSGQEMSINPDVAYSAMSTIKIPILINIFRTLAFAPDKDVKWLMGASILCSSNSASNYLIQLSGAGNVAREKLANGLNQVTNTVEILGAKNSYISAPLYVGDKNYQFSVQAPKTSPNPRLNAKPDPYSQTTAEDMAVLLQHIYDCSEYGSGLMAVFPDGYTQTECKQMIELMSGNIIGRLIELGVPPGTRIAHKNGWGGTQNSGANVSDAAIVYTPGGTYILSAYMWEAQANQDGIGTLQPWEAIEGVSRIVYNYFNPDNPLLISRVPENPLGAVDCVMPNVNYPERLDLNNINNGRFDSDGHMVPDACFNYPQCITKPADTASSGNNPPAAADNPADASNPAANPTGVPPTAAPTSAITITQPPPPPK